MKRIKHIITVYFTDRHFFYKQLLKRLGLFSLFEFIYLQLDKRKISRLMSNGKSNVFIDGGANLGQTIQKYKVLMNDGLHIEAYEPNPMCVEVLKTKLVAENRLQIHQCGIGRISGEFTLKIPVNGGVYSQGASIIESPDP